MTAGVDAGAEDVLDAEVFVFFLGGGGIFELVHSLPPPPSLSLFMMRGGA